MQAIGGFFTEQFLQDNVAVFDGGNEGQSIINSNVTVDKFKLWRIGDGGLAVCHPPSGDQGLVYFGKLTKNQPSYYYRFWKHLQLIWMVRSYVALWLKLPESKPI